MIPADRFYGGTSAVLLDEVRAARREPLHLPMPLDQRLLAMTGQLLKAPTINARLDRLAALAAIAPRTARRLFLGETGMTFAE